MSFLLDPPLRVAAGAAIERGAPSEPAARALSVGTTLTFVGVSAALYARPRVLRWLWGPFGARDGREFMLSSGLARVRHERMRPHHHALALGLFALYPGWLEVGRRAGRRR